MRCGALILGLAACGCLSAQQASFGGVVINAVTKEPMAGVHVVLSSALRFPDASQPYSANSGADGRFSIPNVPAGVYTLAPRRNGFLYLQDENRDFPDIRIVLKPGDAITDRIVGMTPAAIISGRVVDEYGDSVERAFVRVTAPGVDSGMSPSLSRMTAQTDDRGVFRITGAPGRFRISVSAGRGGSNEVRTDGSEVPVYAETWYPSTDNQDRATLVDAIAGREASGIDIRLVRKRSFTISGVVTGTPAGSTRARIHVHSKFYGYFPPTDGDGRFTLSGLPAGQYSVRAHYEAGGIELNSASEDVPLETASRTNVTLSLASAEALPGTLKFEGGPVTPNVKVRIEPLQSVNWVEIKGGDVDREGKFSATGVFPGKYRVRVDSLPENAFIKSISLDGAPVAGSIVDLSRGVKGSDLGIVIGLNGASVEGTVSSEDGKPVCCAMVVVADSVESVNDRMKSVRAGETYRFTGLPPGKYRLIVAGPARPYGTLAAEELFAQSPEIELHEGDRITRDVTFKPRGVR